MGTSRRDVIGLMGGDGKRFMTTQSLTDQAVTLHRSGNFAAAEQLYRAALAADPRDFTARHLLGVTLAQQGRGEDALREIAEALTLRPGDADALLNHANVLKTLGRESEALAGFTRVGSHCFFSSPRALSRFRVCRLPRLFGAGLAEVLLSLPDRIDRAIRFRSRSTSITFTLTISPAFTTSWGSLTKWLARADICTSPS